MSPLVVVMVASVSNPPTSARGPWFADAGRPVWVSEPSAWSRKALMPFSRLAPITYVVPPTLAEPTAYTLDSRKVALSVTVPTVAASGPGMAVTADGTLQFPLPLAVVVWIRVPPAL